MFIFLSGGRLFSIKINAGPINADFVQVLFFLPTVCLNFAAAALNSEGTCWLMATGSPVMAHGRGGGRNRKVAERLTKTATMRAVSDTNVAADKGPGSPCSPSADTAANKGLRGGRHKDGEMSARPAERLIGMS